MIELPNTPETQLFRQGTDEDKNAGQGENLTFLNKKEGGETAPPEETDELSQSEINDSLAEGLTIGVQIFTGFTMPRVVNEYRKATKKEGRINATVAGKAANMDVKTETRIKKLTQRVLDYYLTDTEHPLTALLIVIFFYMFMSFDKMNDIAENEGLKEGNKAKDLKIKELEKALKEKGTTTETKEETPANEEVRLPAKRRGRPKKINE